MRLRSLVSSLKRFIVILIVTLLALTALGWAIQALLDLPGAEVG